MSQVSFTIFRKWKGESKGRKGSRLTLDSHLVFVRPAVALTCISFTYLLLLYILAQAHSIRKERDFFGDSLETKQHRRYPGVLLFEVWCFIHIRKNLKSKAPPSSKQAQSKLQIQITFPFDALFPFSRLSLTSLFPSFCYQSYSGSILISLLLPTHSQTKQPFLPKERHTC